MSRTARPHRAVAAIALPATMAVMLAATPATAGSPAPLAAGTAPMAERTVELVPGYLPPGFDQAGTEDITIPGPEGGLRHVRVTRYEGTGTGGGAAVIYLETVKGIVPVIAADEDAGTTVIDLRGRSATYGASGAVQEFVFDPSAEIPDVTATVGATGGVPYEQLELVAALARPVETLLLGQSHVDEGTVNADVTDSLDPTINSTVDGATLPPDEGGCGSSCPSSTNMKGTGVWENDWSTDGANRTLDPGEQGNDVGVWQAILWADQYGGDWSVYNRGLEACEVDGVFGWKTHNYTKHWQTMKAEWYLTSDGIVGPATWGAADDRLRGQNGLIVYRGNQHNLYFKRSRSTTHYTWSWNFSGYRYTGYSGIHIKRATCNPRLEN